MYSTHPFGLVVSAIVGFGQISGIIVLISTMMLKSRPKENFT